MNLSMVTSFIIAGMIMLGIVMVNINVSNSTAELTIAQITKSHVSNITDMINDDFSNIGYDVNETTQESIGKIFDCKLPNRISFYRNIHDDPDVSPKLIEWEFKKTEDVPGTNNEDHRPLVRTVYDDDGSTILDQTEILLGVTKFELLYFDDSNYGKPKSEGKTSSTGCSAVTNVKQIHVELEVQSAEKMYKRSTGDGRYVSSVWDKRFTPINLNLE